MVVAAEVSTDVGSVTPVRLWVVEVSATRVSGHGLVTVGVVRSSVYLLTARITTMSTAFVNDLVPVSMVRASATTVYIDRASGTLCSRNGLSRVRLNLVVKCLMRTNLVLNMRMASVEVVSLRSTPLVTVVPMALVVPSCR